MSIVLPENIQHLRESVCRRMSEKRFSHSVGVAEYAYRMAQDLGVSEPLDYYVAGILHDIAKEMPREEQMEIMKIDTPIYHLCEEDLLSPTLFHGFCAPYIVLRDYPDFAKDDILYAICYHTVGREDMTLFEKVIFLADYIEPTRIYPDCVRMREMYENGVASGEDVEHIINRCMLKVLDNTLNFLQNRDYFISRRTHQTRNSILASL